MAQSMQERQQQGLTLLCWQHSNGLMDSLALHSIRLTGWGRKGRPTVIKRPQYRLGAPLVSPQFINGPIPRQAQDPHTRRSARLIRPSVAPDEKEDLLGEVCGACPIS